MDKFVTKSPVNRGEKSLKRKGNDYDKQYDAKKRKRNFQMSWLREFAWLALDIKIKPLKLANEMSCLYLFISPNYGFCQTFTIRSDEGLTLETSAF